MPCVGEGNMGFKDKVKGGHVAHASEDIMMIPRRNKVKVTAEMGSAGENIQKQSNSDISVSGSSN